MALAALQMSSNANCSVIRVRDDTDYYSDSVVDITNNFKNSNAQTGSESNNDSTSPKSNPEKKPNEDESGNSDNKEGQVAAATYNGNSTAQKEGQAANGEQQGTQPDGAQHAQMSENKSNESANGEK